MERAAPARKRHVEDTEAPREAVPQSVYEGVDFEAFNAKVAEFRDTTESHGFDASLSKLAGVPTAVVQRAARTL